MRHSRSTILQLFILVSIGFSTTRVFAKETSFIEPDYLISQISVKKKNSKTSIKKKKKDTGQDAEVKVDGSAVYEVANFDSPILAYLDRGKKVKISKKLYPGIGGLGAFYKLRLRKGVYGYITDTDVTLFRGGQPREQSREENEDEGQMDPSEVQEGLFKDSEESDIGNSFYLSRYIGLVYSQINYAEEISNKLNTANTTMFGVKYSSPSGRFGGMPLDTSLVFSTTAPSFYDKYFSSASGFVIIADAMAMLPFYESKSFLIYYGLGLMLRYSKWTVLIKARPNTPGVDSQELGIGAGLMAGFGVRLTESLAFKADFKYYYENESYSGFGGALQYKF